MNKKEAIKDAKLKRKMFPNIGKLYILRQPDKKYFSVSEKYYNDHELNLLFRVRKVI